MTTLENFDRYQSDIADLYCGGSESGVDALARQYGVSPDQVLLELSRFAAAARFLREAPRQEPSAWSLNKIMAHAREAAEKNRQPFFMRWRRAAWFAPLLAGATAAALFLEVRAPMTATEIQKPQVTAQAAPSRARSVAAESFAGFLRHHPFTTDFETQDPVNRPLRGSVSLAQNVGFGNLPASLSEDDGLAAKPLAGPLSDREVETLYLRARQSENQGRYQNALRDYDIIARFHPDFGAYQTVPLGMARCLAQLDRKDAALILLKKYEDAYGHNDKIEAWIDQLRSVSF